MTLTRRMAETLETSAASTPSGGDPSAPSGPGARFHYGAYLLIILLLPPLLFVGALFFARTDYFLHISKRTLWIDMAYHMDDEAGQNCQVVIFGDSTAMIGLDPRAIQARTGLKTCNLALPYMAVSASGTMVLDHYLAANRPPAFIIFAGHITHQRPPAFDEQDGIIDGWWFVDRYFSPAQAARFFLKTPRDTFLFVAQVWQALASFTDVIHPDFTQRTYARTMAELHRREGFYTMEYHLGHDAICHPGYPPLRADPSWFQTLRRKYQTPQRQVVFYVSPVPDCDPDLPRYDAIARQAGVPAPVALPEEDFADPHHLNAFGAAQNSTVLAKDLLRLSAARAQ
jgi:hypothetical protein